MDASASASPWPLERRITAGFLVALSLLLAMAVAAAYAVRAFNRTSERVLHAESVRRQLILVFSHAQDMETGSRGFLLTGQETFLEPFGRGLAAIGTALPELEQLTAGDRFQQDSLQQLGPFIEQKISQMRYGIKLRRDGEAAAAATFVGTAQGKRTMDEIRSLVDRMREHENEQLDSHLHLAHRTARWTTWALAAGLALDFVLLGIVFSIARSGLRVRAKAVREQEEARLYSDSIVETVRHPLLIMRADLTVVRANRSYYQAFRTTPAETEGVYFGQLNDGRWDEPALIERLAQVVPQQAEFSDLELARDFPGIGQKVVLLGARKLYRPGNHTGMLLLAIEDVTERRAAEQERDRFFNISLDLMCIADARAGRFTHVSPAVKDLLGWEPAEFLAQPYMDQIHPEDREASAREVENQVERSEKVLHFENRFRHKDGSWRILSWRSVPQPGGQMYATARDVTARRQGEEEIRRLNAGLQGHARALEAANQELEAFSYSVSHDLRAPLRHIDGFAHLLAKQNRDRLDETGRRHLDVITVSARKLGILIDELLSFSRMGRAEMRRTPTDMQAQVAEVVAELAAGAADRKIDWQIGALPRVPADAAMLLQVWRNLLGNAVKYTRKRPLAVIEVLYRPDEAGGHVFTVRDNGAGFDMQYAGKLFSVFQRLHNDSEFEGTGVGLANVRRVIQRHGGRTWAEGQPDTGAAFHFFLPAEIGEDPSAFPPAPDHERNSQHPPG